MSEVPRDLCHSFLCFIPLDARAPRLFGFSEFLAGLALMVLVWTIADVRYRFRVATAPIPLRATTFFVVTAVGVLSLLTDLWRANAWLVPQGNLLTPAGWQAILGGLFLTSFLTWAWFAIMRPSVFGRTNAERYARAVYWAILRGAPAELPVIADELGYSAGSIIHHAPERLKLKHETPGKGQDKQPSKNPPKVTMIANELLLLIADRRFCRAIVESSSTTALELFAEIGETKKYGVQVEIFAKNLMTEALANRNSFLFTETEGYESGLLGFHRPLSQAMFSNYDMVEGVRTLFEPDPSYERPWDSGQWKAYCRVVLMTFSNYVEYGHWRHSAVLSSAKRRIERAASDLYKINGMTEGAWDNDVHERLRVVVAFIKDAVKTLDGKAPPENVRRRTRRGIDRSSYDHLAGMISEVIFSASAVRSPVDLCWWVQHNAVWAELFNSYEDEDNGAAAKIVRAKALRLVYREISKMRGFPNYKGAKVLGMCLNVMGLTDNSHLRDREVKAFQKAVLRWTKQHFAWLFGFNPRVAQACLVDGFTYEAERLRLVHTKPAEGLRREPEVRYFSVDPAPATEKGEAPPS